MKNNNKESEKPDRSYISRGLFVLLGLISHANLQAYEEEDNVVPYSLKEVVVTAERRE